MPLEQSYTSTPAGSPSGGGAVSTGKPSEYWDIGKCRKAYSNYLFSKREEIDEQIDARRYYHGSQWTAAQIKTMGQRKQPVMTFNRIARKIDGVIGLVERLRQQPKAYPRTPQHQQGADLATAVLRYVLDQQAWKEKSPQTALSGAIDGIGGVELEVQQGDHGDPEVAFDVVDVENFFYDPRSYQPDFSDALYLGVGKWVDEDTAKEMFPEVEPAQLTGNDFELTSNSDREMRWFSTDGVVNRLRLVDIWYKHKDGWCWAVFTGSAILAEGQSPYKDEKGKAFSKYLMFSGNIDQDGDKYGFIRNMKSAQDGINARQSKMQHILASRRLMISHGAVDDIEKIRAEWARPDGVVMTNRPVNEGIRADDQSFDFAGWSKMLELNLAEIENFGPNPALIGQGIENKSGRAIALLQQAGMAELGPYILAYKGWKLRVYRALWNCVQQFWQAERWIRVTDDENMAQFVQINGMQVDPMTGKPQLFNELGAMDVDIILDEGEDTISTMADTYAMLQQVVPSIAPMLTPPMAQEVMKLVIESSGLPADVKKSFRDTAQKAAQQPPPPDPAVQAAQAKIQTEQATAQIKLQSQTQDAQLKAVSQQQDIEARRIQSQMDIETQQKQAEIELLRATNQLQIEQAKAANTMQLERDKCEHDMTAMRDKHQLSMAIDGEAAAAKGDQEFKSSGKDVEIQAVQTMAQQFAESMNRPKVIDVQRDRGGKITGATARPVGA
jgi:predicted DNA-binding protein (UPF0251 family)